LKRLATTALIGLIAISTLSLPACSSEQAPGSAETKTAAPGSLSDQQARRVSTVLLRDARGEQLGSGVVVAEAEGGYWIATNRHVVADQMVACVVVGAIISPAAVLPAGSSKPQPNEDLALLWLPSFKKPALMVADQSAPVEPPEQLPLVVATGYPTPLKQEPDGPNYAEDDGLLLPLLKQPLQGGFVLAYTSVVEKGMSGGGVFQGRRLIGINGAHSHPLWPGQWKDQSSKPVSLNLNQKLEQLSLGIPLETITLRLRGAVIPKDFLPPEKGVCQKPAPKTAGSQRF